MHNNNLRKANKSSIKEYYFLFLIILLGILLRMLFGFFHTNIFDFTNIMTVTNSVALTGNVTAGLSFLHHNSSIIIQIYGKIYYQIIADWILLLENLGLINKNYFTVPNFAIENLTGYQIALIKSIQFLYDFIFLFFLLKIAKLFTSDTKTLYS